MFRKLCISFFLTMALTILGASDSYSQSGGLTNQIYLPLVETDSQKVSAANAPTFMWPVNNHYVTQYSQSGHVALDIIKQDQPTGATIYAAESGTVVFRGWDAACDYPPPNPCGRYLSGGNRIDIAHSQNYKTVYAHLASFLVDNGQSVTKGITPIGIMGDSGHIDGDDLNVHLHFEIRQNGSQLDPLPLLSGEPNSSPPPSISITNWSNGDAAKDVGDIEVSIDSAGGVQKVEFTAFYSGGWHSLGTDTNGSNGWKYSKSEMNGPTLPEQHGVIIHATVHNPQGSSTTAEVSNITIDRTPPSIALDTTHDQYYREITAYGEQVGDFEGSGISKVRFHFAYDGQEDRVSDTNGSDGWRVIWTIPSGHSPNEVKVLAYAIDRAGNETQSGQLTLTADNAGPTFNALSEPEEGGWVHGTHTIATRVTDPAGIASVKVFVYYKQDVNGNLIRHDYQLKHQSGDTWKLDHNLLASGKQALAQEGAWLQFIATDQLGNQSTSGTRNFNIYIKNYSLYVDAKKEWGQMNSDWVNRLPVMNGSFVSVQYASGKAYYAPGGGYGPEGKGSIEPCISRCLVDGQLLSLVGRYSNKDNSSPFHAHVGGFYEAHAPRTGWFRMGFNDVKGQFGDNSGGYNVLVDIWPSHSKHWPRTRIEIKEKALLANGICPRIELWIESAGSLKKVGDWDECDTNWNINGREVSDAYLKEPYAVWVRFTNDSSTPGDQNYYIQYVKINGKQINVTDPNVVYWRGEGEDAFKFKESIPGQEQMGRDGATRFPF